MRRESCGQGKDGRRVKQKQTLGIEQRIRDVLKKVDGVGEVDVMLTLFSSSERCCGG